MSFFYFPLTKVPCDATTTCNGHGSCTNDGDCECDSGFYAVNCSGKLSFNRSTIKIFFEILNALFWIPFVIIVECDAAKNCSSQGICGPDGACDCDPSFYGENCISKIRKICDEYLLHFETNIFLSIFFVAACHYLFTCSGHGLCSNVGTCLCDEGFYGDSCSSKHNELLLVFCQIFCFCWPRSSTSVLVFGRWPI